MSNGRWKNRGKADDVSEASRWVVVGGGVREKASALVGIGTLCVSESRDITTIHNLSGHQAVN